MSSLTYGCETSPSWVTVFFIAALHVHEKENDDKLKKKLKNSTGEVNTNASAGVFVYVWHANRKCKTQSNHI